MTHTAAIAASSTTATSELHVGGMALKRVGRSVVLSARSSTATSVVASAVARAAFLTVPVLTSRGVGDDFGAAVRGSGSTPLADGTVVASPIDDVIIVTTPAMIIA